MRVGKTALIWVLVLIMLTLSVNAANFIANATIGDGFVGIAAEEGCDWNCTRNASIGNRFSYSNDYLWVRSYSISTSNGTDRGFTPIDTSGLPDGALIINASFNINHLTRSGLDTDFIVLVGNTSQAAADQLGNSDFAQCAAVDNPTEFSDRYNTTVEFAVESGWHQWELNDAGKAAINDTGITLIGIRSNYDILNVAPALGTTNFVRFNTYQSGNITFLNITYNESVSPTYSNLQNNAPQANSTANWTIDLEDNAVIDSYVFAHNLSTCGGFIGCDIYNTRTDCLYYECVWYENTTRNVTTVQVGASSISASYNYTVNVKKGSYVCGQYWVNDSFGNWNITSLSCFNVANIPPAAPDITPTAVTNYTGNAALTCAGGDLDNDTLYYEFYADKNNPPTTLKQNTTGGSYSLSFTSTGNWYFRCRSHDTDDAGDYSSVTELYVDYVPPTFSNVQNNASSSKMHDNVSFGANISDDRGLSFGRVANNRTGDFVNGSLVELSGTAGYLNSSLIINWSKGTELCFMIWANDTLGNANTTVSCFDTVNSPPVLNSLQINNSPILLGEDSNVSWIFTDVDNDTQAGFNIKWFVNGEYNSTGDDQRLFLSGNYTTGDQVLAMVNVSDGSDTTAFSNTSIVTVADVIPPLINGFVLLYSTLTDASGHTNNFTINASDLGSNIDTANFTLNLSSNALADVSFTVPSLKSVNISYEIFKSLETLTAGSYNVTNVQVCDSSGNCNSTTDSASFPDWAGYPFTVTVAPTPVSPGSPSPGGGGGTGCPEGTFRDPLTGDCVPVENLPANATNLTLTPSRVNFPFFFYSAFWRDEANFTQEFLSNWQLVSAGFLDNETKFGLEIRENVSVLVTLPVEATPSFGENYKVTMKVVDKYGRVKYSEIVVKTFNPAAYIPLRFNIGMRFKGVFGWLQLFVKERGGYVEGIRYASLLWVFLIALFVVKQKSLKKALTKTLMDTEKAVKKVLKKAGVET